MQCDRGSRASEGGDGGAVGFDHRPRTRIVFGAGVVDSVGELAAELGDGPVLVVTDAGVSATGHVGRVVGRLAAAGLDVSVFDRVRENPTTADVDDCVAAARAAGARLILGLGGGSSLDTARGCNFLVTNGGRMADYRGVGRATRPMLPMIGIPTTAGTGSECQSFALIADEDTHQKMACGDRRAACAVALLDPTLTLTQPRHVAACTGIDAITHAVESFVTTKRNALSMMYAREAFRLTVAHLGAVLDGPGAQDIHARGAMLLGAALAGLAIENSMLGAAHAAANPLTARHGLVHGHAVGLMLPHVVRFNAGSAAASAAYADLARSAGLAEGDDDDAALGALLARFESLLDATGLPRSLADCGIGAEHVSALADDAAPQWTARFNPRPVDHDAFTGLYAAALRPPAR